MRRTFAVAIVAIAVPLQILQFTPDEWDLQTSLPFQLCDFGWVFAVHALWTRNRLSATITYLWGITLTTQGIFTPDLASDFPEARFLMFWGMHLLIVWASFFLVLGLRILPTWHTYRQTIAITLAWAVSAYVFNVIAGTNTATSTGCRRVRRCWTTSVRGRSSSCSRSRSSPWCGRC